MSRSSNQFKLQCLHDTIRVIDFKRAFAGFTISTGLIVSTGAIPIVLVYTSLCVRSPTDVEAVPQYHCVYSNLHIHLSSRLDVHGTV